MNKLTTFVLGAIGLSNGNSPFRIIATPPKAVTDKKAVAIGDGNGPFRIIATPPKAVA
jgi:hypothetical protein